ncbi:GNAT family N-acetyltransferase [Maridesulfovibrio sp.]|uniref:GNAT family N-acetyltransferase n=1 Tax=Maridesulfovibrio sp. TaxID=2795000 RepID=UPI002A18B1DA|nr:GNAT family N-acetyltransferase [Maridesulfovibrio sp.]
MINITPPGCVHALDLEALRRPEITFWSVWYKEELLGCVALKELDQYHAEIKSMRTATIHQGKGVASYLLRFIINEARRRDYKQLNLETGSYEAFEPARKLYEKFGFTYCGPFADYKKNANSTFMSLDL